MRILGGLERERASLTTPRPPSLAGVDRDLFRRVATARVLEMRYAFQESRRAAAGSVGCAR
jgi:hypothetical protein